MKHFYLIMLLLWSVSNAKADEMTHIAAHVGASAAINTWAYGFFHKAVKMDKIDSFIMASFVTLAIGAAYKMAEANDHYDPNFSVTFKKAMFRNAIGVGVSIGTCLMFDF